MEPIKINVNIEVGLKQSTIDALSQIFGARVHVTAAHVEEPAAETQPEVQPKSKAKKPAPQPAPEPQPQGADPEGTGAEDIGDLPPADAPTESDARNAVQAARKRGVPAAKVKEYMKDTFGISSSVECPAERRQELIDGLNKLAA